MHRPLWQILLTLFVVAFVLRRAAVAFLVRAEGLDPVLVAAYVFQVAAGVAAAVGLWAGRHWVIGAVLVLGVSVAATALLEGFFLGVLPAPAALSQVLVAAVATGGLALILRHELGESGTARRSDGTPAHEDR